MPIDTSAGGTQFIRIDLINEKLYIRQNDDKYHIVEDINEIIEEYNETVLDIHVHDQITSDQCQVVQFCQEELHRLSLILTLSEKEEHDKLYFEQIIQSMPE